MSLFADESEALTHPYLARARAKCGADLRVPAPGQAKKIAMMGALDHAARRLIVHTSRTKRSADFRALLETLDGMYGPRPGVRMKPVVIVVSRKLHSRTRRFDGNEPGGRCDQTKPLESRTGRRRASAGAAALSWLKR